MAVKKLHAAGLVLLFAAQYYFAYCNPIIKGHNNHCGLVFYVGLRVSNPAAYFFCCCADQLNALN